MSLRSRLEEKRPFLYVPRSFAPGRHSLLSPLELASESDLAPRAQASFSEALAEAVDLETDARKLSALRARLESALKKRLDRARRLEEKLRGDQASLEEPSALRRRGELLLAGLTRARKTGDGRAVVVPDLFQVEEKDIEIEIDPRLSLPKNAERFFTRARKAERAGVELARRLETVGTDVSLWEGFECDLRDAASVVELLALEREAREEGLSIAPSGKPSKRRPPEALGPRAFRSHRGSAILVGRSGRSNDELTFEVAKPHDLWFHAAGVPGAHVVLRAPSGATADEREIREAAELAAYFSKAREDTAVDVIVTERRHVSRVKGAPRGLVKLAWRRGSPRSEGEPSIPDNMVGMKAEILAVGEELLAPGRVETNSLYLTEKLAAIGVPVGFRGIVGDEEGAVAAANARISFWCPEGSGPRTTIAPGMPPAARSVSRCGSTREFSKACGGVSRSAGSRCPRSIGSRPWFPRARRSSRTGEGPRPGSSSRPLTLLGEESWCSFRDLPASSSRCSRSRSSRG
jgi:hypothetical protein